MATLVGDALEGRTINLIGEVLQKGQARSTHNRRACMISSFIVTCDLYGVHNKEYSIYLSMIRCMNVDEARGLCKDSSRWRSALRAVQAVPAGTVQAQTRPVGHSACGL